MPRWSVVDEQRAKSTVGATTFNAAGSLLGAIDE